MSPTTPACELTAHALLRLVNPGRIEPEFGMLGDEDARRCPFADSAFAKDDRLPALEQGIADAGPFLEGDPARFG